MTVPFPRKIVAASLARKPGSDAGITAGVGLFGSLGQDGDLALIRRDDAHRVRQFPGDWGSPLKTVSSPFQVAVIRRCATVNGPGLYGDSLIVSGGGEGHSCLIASGFRGEVG